MKKKLANVLTLCLIVCVLAVSLTACGVFGGGSKKVNITVYNDGTAKQFSVTVGETARIDPVMKVGYYPTGFYDSETGGTKYFDANGNSASVWQENYPTTFYAQYKSIEGYPKIEWHEDENKSYDSDTVNFYYQLKGQDYYAIMGNLDRQVRLRYHFKAKRKTSLYSSNYIRVRFTDASGDKGENFGKYYEREISSSDYKEYFVEVTCSARVFHNGGTVYVQLKVNGDSEFGGDLFYFKECYLVATLL